MKHTHTHEGWSDTLELSLALLWFSGCCPKFHLDQNNPFVPISTPIQPSDSRDINLCFVCRKRPLRLLAVTCRRSADKEVEQKGQITCWLLPSVDQSGLFFFFGCTKLNKGGSFFVNSFIMSKHCATCGLFHNYVTVRRWLIRTFLWSHRLSDSFQSNSAMCSLIVTISEAKLLWLN